MSKHTRLITRDAPSTGALQHATVTLDHRLADTEARTVPAVLSTGAEVDRLWGRERLEISERAVDLTRAARGLPLLWVHDQSRPIGRVQDIRVDGAELRGTLRFGRSAFAEEAWQDVVDGVLTDVSIGYRVAAYSQPEGAGGARTATSWSLWEASLVAVPADAGARIQRDGQDDEDDDEGGAPSLEQRNAELAQVFRPFPQHADLLLECLARSDSPAQARDHLLERLGTQSAGGGTPPRGAAQLVHDQADKVRDAVRMALDVANPAEPVPFTGARGSGSARTPQIERRCAEVLREHTQAHESAGTNPYTGLTVLELCRAYFVDALNIREAARWSPGVLADAALGRVPLTHRAIIGHGTSDFTNLLSNNIGKQVLAGYTEAPETWQQWCRVGRLRDMRSEDRPVMSTFSDLDDVTSGIEYEYGSFSDKKETIVAKRWGKLFSITRSALLNDDQNAFSEIPRHMGRAANRMVGDEVYARLTANAAMGEDATALFHANHSNLVASGAAPAVAELNTMLTSMATQTDPGGNVLNLRPAFLLVPWALWGTSRALLVSERVTGSENNDRNVWQAALEQVTEARLDANSAVAWYIAAAPSSVGTVEVGFVDGMQTPFLEQEEQFTRDGVAYKVRLEVGTGVLDFRGLAKNNGT